MGLSRKKQQLEKLNLYFQERGFKGAVAPMDRLLLRLGFDVEPCMFWSFWKTTFIMGGFWGFWMAIFLFTIDLVGVSIVQIITLLIGALAFGVLMAFVHRRNKRKLGITTWEIQIEVERK